MAVTFICYIFPFMCFLLCVFLLRDMFSYIKIVHTVMNNCIHLKKKKSYGFSRICLTRLIIVLFTYQDLTGICIHFYFCIFFHCCPGHCCSLLWGTMPLSIPPHPSFLKLVYFSWLSLNESSCCSQVFFCKMELASILLQVACICSRQFDVIK